MFTQKLIDAGIRAKEARIASEVYAYQKEIQTIDRLSAQIRKLNPEKYWSDGSPEYAALTDYWQAEREMREALKKAAA
jgi:hypothetical protein